MMNDDFSKIMLLGTIDAGTTTVEAFRAADSTISGNFYASIKPAVERFVEDNKGSLQSIILASNHLIATKT